MGAQPGEVQGSGNAEQAEISERYDVPPLPPPTEASGKAAGDAGIEEQLDVRDVMGRAAQLAGGVASQVVRVAGNTAATVADRTKHAAANVTPADARRVGLKIAAIAPTVIGGAFGVAKGVEIVRDRIAPPPPPSLAQRARSTIPFIR